MPAPKHPFDYHKPNPAQVEQIATIRAACKALNQTLLETLPSSRERSLAITNLEQVSMWANKAAIMYDEGEIETDRPEPPPADNAHVASGCEKFAE